MKIKYRIIWFEDDPRWLKSVKPFIQDALEDMGFSLVLKPYTGTKNLNPLWGEINASDLIVMDLTLPDKQGDKIIEEIRNRNIFTEVIFYSRKGEKTVRKLVNDKELDGVYCADRKDCKDTVIEVIKMTVRKVQDVNALRGLVMAEESELQSLMAEILWELHSRNHTLASFTKKHGYDSTAKYLKDTLDLLAKIDPKKDYDKLFNMSVYGAAGKQMTLLAFLKENIKTDSNFKSPHNLMKSYPEDVIKERNDLAHSVEVEEKGKIFLVNRQKKTRQVFTEDKCIKIRKNLRKHRGNLEAILALIKAS